MRLGYSRWVYRVGVPGDIVCSIRPGSNLPDEPYLSAPSKVYTPHALLVPRAHPSYDSEYSAQLSA